LFPVTLPYFGNKDLDGDVIEPGAFSKTIQERGPAGKQLIKYLLDHDKNKVVAKMMNLYEDQKGLEIRGKNRKLMQLVKISRRWSRANLLTSIRLVSVQLKKCMTIKAKANLIKEVMMYEGSAVQFLGANPETTFIDLKNESDAFEYLTRLEKFVKTSDATDETLEKLESQLKSLLEMLKPAEATLVETKAVEVEILTINELKKQFESWKI
jgi:uncharacterized protein